MKHKTILLGFAILLLAAGALVLLGQNAQITGIITDGEKASIAVPDFRGAGEAQKVMNAFNATLWSELDGAGVLKMVGKTYYPLQVPQQPADFKPPTGTSKMTDWSGAPVNANDLAFGYSGVTPDGQLVMYGWLYNLSQSTPESAQLISRSYFGPLNDEGAKKVAREFAADILKFFGATSLAGSKIYFVSDRTGNKEIWSMDYDGSNQRQLTRYKTITTQPTVSPNGKLLAFNTYPQEMHNGHVVDKNPVIMIHSTETGNKLTFYNQDSSNVETPEFSPDGQRLFFSVAFDAYAQICTSNLQGGEFQRISRNRFIEVSPKVNPKTGRDMLFISGRSGKQQLWHSNVDGTGAEMLTTGEGDVANPVWRSDGQTIAFSWTRGYEIGGFNIFVMDIGKRVPVQLTREGGRNENPSWAPDGFHIVFSSKRGRSTQLYTMLADGTHVQALTTQGNNLQPVWAKAIN